MEQAETVEDLITIESRLSEIRYQIQSYESTLRTYDNQVNYSTLHLAISEVKKLTPQEEPSVWKKIQDGFIENLDQVIKGVRDFFVEVMIAIPYLLLWGIVLFFGCWIKKKHKGKTIIMVTFEENAIIKAKYIAELTGITALSDDSGLEVNALDGKPGVYSARYAGEKANTENNNAKLLKELEGITDRRANFTSVIAICYPNGKIITARGTTYGRILEKLEGNNGFGYDPLFFSNDLQKSFGIATSEEKNKVSHRGLALQKMKELRT